MLTEMNMAYIVFLLVVFTVCIYSPGNANTAFIEVKCQLENMGRYGQQSLLKCVIQTGQNVADVKIVVVTWKKDGDEKPLLVYNKEKTIQQPRYSFAEPSWNDRNMDVSLLISNTVVKDEGSYICTVMTDSGYGSTNTKLKVTAKYNAPTIKLSTETATPNADVALTCKSDGGYPEGKIRWFDEHKADWTKSSKMTATPTKEGLIQLSSTLTLLKGSTFSKYTCAVFNASEDQEYETMFEIPRERQTGKMDELSGSNSASKIVAPIVVIGSLIVGLLILLLYYHRRRVQRARRQSATPLMGDRQGVPVHETDADEGDDTEMEKTQNDNMV